MASRCRAYRRWRSRRDALGDLDGCLLQVSALDHPRHKTKFPRGLCVEISPSKRCPALDNVPHSVAAGSSPCPNWAPCRYRHRRREIRCCLRETNVHAHPIASTADAISMNRPPPTKNKNLGGKKRKRGPPQFPISSSSPNKTKKPPGREGGERERSIEAFPVPHCGGDSWILHRRWDSDWVGMATFVSPQTTPYFAPAMPISAWCPVGAWA